MNKKQKGLFCAGAFLLAVLFMVICFCFFPQYLYQVVYWVNTSEIMGESQFDALPSHVLTENFIPQQSYLDTINVHVTESVEGNLLVGRLYDYRGNTLEQYTVEAENGYVSFPVQRHVKTGETYTFSIMGHEDNSGAVTITFGTAVEGPEEHVASWENGSEEHGVLWTQYIYNACSRKLLAVWFIVFLAAAFWVLETVCKQSRNLDESV